MRDITKLEFTEIEKERNFFIKKFFKKSLKIRVSSVVLTIIALISTLTLHKLGRYVGQNNFIPSLIGFFTLMDILLIIKLVVAYRKEMKKPIQKNLISLLLKSDGFCYSNNKYSANFSFSEVEKLDMPASNKSLIIEFKKRTKDKRVLVPGLIIYSNAFKEDKSREQFIEIFNQHLASSENSCLIEDAS